MELIRAAQRSGLTLANIKKIFTQKKDQTLDCGGLRSILEDRAKQIKAQISELRKAQNALNQAVKECLTSQSGSFCNDLCSAEELNC